MTFDFFSDIILAGLENVDIFTPTMLIRLIGFMLMLEFMGGVFGTIADSLHLSGKR